MQHQMAASLQVQPLCPAQWRDSALLARLAAGDDITDAELEAAAEMSGSSATSSQQADELTRQIMDLNEVRGWSRLQCNNIRVHMVRAWQ